MRVGRSLRQKLWFDCARNQYLQNVRSELQDTSQVINLEIQGVFPGHLLPNSWLGPPGVILKVWVISMEMTWTSRNRHSSGAGEWSWRLSPLLSAAMLVSGSWRSLRIQGRCWGRCGSGVPGQVWYFYPTTCFSMPSPLSQLVKAVVIYEGCSSAQFSHHVHPKWVLGDRCTEWALGRAF